MRVTSFLARTEGNVAESKILFLIQNYLLHTLLDNLSAIFPYFYTYFPHNSYTLRSHAILWHVRMLSFGTCGCYLCLNCYGYLRLKS